MKKQKVILFANTDWYLYNFRLSLAKGLRDNGFDVVLVSPAGAYSDKFEALGFRWMQLDFSGSGINPFKELLLLFRIIRLYYSERPIMVKHFTIKCALYGTLAARIVGGIKTVNSITGLGHIFTAKNLKVRIIRQVVKLLYRLVLSHRNVRVIFQNEEDRDQFIVKGLVPSDHAKLIRGSGVNLELFNPDEVMLSEPRRRSKLKLLFASRLLREKGIDELIEATRHIYENNHNISLVIAGDIYQGNPTSLNERELEEIKRLPFVDFRGHVDDMPRLLKECDIVVLPSYREGTPKILLEAAAMGKPIVATNIAGCIGVVEDAQNGILVPVKDSVALAKAIQYLAEHPEIRRQYGKVSQEIARTRFDEVLVLEKTYDVFLELNPYCSSN